MPCGISLTVNQGLWTTWSMISLFRGSCFISPLDRNLFVRGAVVASPRSPWSTLRPPVDISAFTVGSHSSLSAKGYSLVTEHAQNSWGRLAVFRVGQGEQTSKLWEKRFDRWTCQLCCSSVGQMEREIIPVGSQCHWTSVAAHSRELLDQGSSNRGS